ncbi:hypothetical protein GW17_00040764 [Ensete ventricosum]|nr:hypothetical protein GW17_00040764 [Ensete ventricosum]
MYVTLVASSSGSRGVVGIAGSGMDLWQRAKGLAEEAAKRSQDLTRGAARISQEFVSETTKKSKEIAAEASKKADLIRSEALRAADQIKTLAIDIPIPIPSTLGQGSSAAVAPDPGSDLERFGVTEELREFVKGIQLSTFRDFPMQGIYVASEVVLMICLCLCVMRILDYFVAYFSVIAYIGYEKQYMEDLKTKAEESQVDIIRENPIAVSATAAKAKETKPQKTTTSSTVEDLDVFLLGDLGSDDEGTDDGNDGLDDDLNKIGSTSVRYLTNFQHMKFSSF